MSFICFVLLTVLAGVALANHDVPMFHEDFFSSNIPSLIKAFNDLKLTGRGDLAFLEIGSFEGRSTRWFMEEIVTHPTAHLTCIDTWLGSDEMPQRNKVNLYPRFVHNIFPFLEKMTIVRGDANKMLSKQIITEKMYDVIYIDADHYAKSALTQAVLTWPLLKSGGVMVWDDYRWEANCGVNNEALHCPKQGVDMFVKLHREELSVVIDGYQYAVQKK